jgi:glycosyltransferase involved in cell wall biosynthesis
MDAVVVMPQGACVTQNPNFTVIIPAYNSERTVVRAVESALTQSYAACEVILVDDASTDGTAEALSNFRDRIVYIRCSRNGGVAAARNLGAANARGDWLAFLDADDYFYPRRLAAHAEWIAQDPTLVMLTGDYEYRDADGGLLGTSLQNHAAGRAISKRFDPAGRAILPDSELEEFVADHFGDTHTLSVTREKFLSVGGYPVGFKVCEDVHLLTRLVASSRRVAVTRELLGVYVVHEASATRRNPVQAQYENVRTLVDLMQRTRDSSSLVRRGVARRLRAARLNLAYALLRTGQRRAALRAVAESFRERPSIATVRDLLSVIKG